MIQYYLDLERQVKTIKEKALSQGQIQKLYSTAYYISFTIRVPGKTWHLYFGRGGGHEGIWLHDAPPTAILRRKDHFLEYFRRHLSSCTFLGLTLDPHDRIVKFAYQKFGQIQSFLWFWKGRKLYFLHHYQEIPEGPFKLLLSWRGKAFIQEKEESDLFSYFDEIGRDRELGHKQASENFLNISDLLEKEKDAAETKGMVYSPTFLERKVKNIEDDLRRAKQWIELQDMLDRGDNLDSIYELKCLDQKVKFEGVLNSYERRNLVFQKIKKLKRGEKILTERLETVKEQLEGNKKTYKEESILPMIKPIWGDEKKTLKTAPQTSADEFKVFSVDNIQFGVGLNSHGNDQLRNKWAKKDDYWLHLDQQKSSHVVVKVPSGLALSSEILNQASTILAHFSHFKDDWIPIIYTQVKNLKGVSGSPGMVIYKKEKHLKCPRIDLGTLLKE